MKKLLLATCFCLALSGCANPKNTELPTKLSEMESIKPEVEKLEDGDKDLLQSYLVRHALVAQFSGSEKDSVGIPEGVTIGKAIEEQRKFIEDQNAEAAKQAALKVELEAKREAAIKPMREAVTVTLVSKAIQEERGMSGLLMDEHLSIVFGYRNNTEKDIAGVKGYVSVQDLFGDEISGFAISNDDTIPAGQSVTWTGSRSVRYSTGDNKDRKLADLDESKYKVLWTPKVIVFADGSKLEVPDGGSQ